MAKYTPYKTTFDCARRVLGVSKKEAVAAILETIHYGTAGSCAANELAVLAGETAWDSMGRPSYRIAPHLVQGLMRTSLDIEARYLRFPHSVFSIEIPNSIHIRNNDEERLESLLICSLAPASSEHQTREQFVLDCVPIPPNGTDPIRLIFVEFWEDSDKKGVANLTISLEPGHVISERLKTVFTRPGHDSTIVSDTTLSQMVSLGLGAALFAVGSGRFVKWVGSANKNRQGKRNNKKKSDKIWMLGTDIRLPGTKSKSSDSHPGEPTGRHLKWAHLVQGHLKMQPRGPANDRSYSLIYIAPTVARPDLEFPPQATRHVIDTS